jgi:chromosome segregation ATPase
MSEKDEILQAEAAIRRLAEEMARHSEASQYLNAALSEIRKLHGDTARATARLDTACAALEQLAGQHDQRLREFTRVAGQLERTQGSLDSSLSTFNASLNSLETTLAGRIQSLSETLRSTALAVDDQQRAITGLIRRFEDFDQGFSDTGQKLASAVAALERLNEQMGPLRTEISDLAQPVRESRARLDKLPAEFAAACQATETRVFEYAEQSRTSTNTHINRLESDLSNRLKHLEKLILFMGLALVLTLACGSGIGLMLYLRIFKG